MKKTWRQKGRQAAKKVDRSGEEGVKSYLTISETRFLEKDGIGENAESNSGRCKMMGDRNTAGSHPKELKMTASSLSVHQEIIYRHRVIKYSKHMEMP